MSSGRPDDARLSDVSEDELLAELVPLMPPGPASALGPGDDAALVRVDGESVVATTDTMVRGRDWLDEWSTASDVGAKVVCQNVADVAAMGGTATALLVTLAADPDTRVDWVLDLTRAIATAAADAGVGVAGGDLSSAPSGVLMISVTALGELAGRRPVLRSGAHPGDVIAVAGSLGRSGAGLLLLQQGRAQDDPELVAFHRRPRAPYEQGPVAAAGGATSMLDLSDGLVRDAARVATASGVRMALDSSRLRDDVDRLSGVLSASEALECVLTGGEEHSLLATWPPDVALPEAWRPLGVVEPARDGEPSGVLVDGQPATGGGWDHFRG